MNVTLTWAANSESDLLKYVVAHGPASGVYTTTQDVSAPTTTVNLTGLPNGKPWYFAVKAVDNGLNESAYSSAVSVSNKHVKVR